MRTRGNRETAFAVRFATNAASEAEKGLFRLVERHWAVVEETSDSHEVAAACCVYRTFRAQRDSCLQCVFSLWFGERVSRLQPTSVQRGS